MATVIKVEPDSDSETGPLSPSELDDPDEVRGAVPFTFVPVQTEIKIENDELPFLEGEEEEITVDVTPIEQEMDDEEEEEHEMYTDEHSVVQFTTEHDPYAGVTSIAPTDHESSTLALNPFGADFHLPSSHSLLRTRLEQDGTRLRKRPGRIVCNACGKHFRFPCDFKRHSVMHTGERDFECDECQKRFKLLSHLKMHIYRFHAGERPYPCDNCGKRYASVTDLRCHTLIHSPERPHVCPVCSKGFIAAKDLRKHMQIHSGEKRFECDVCKRKFLRRGHLEKHILVVHTRKRHHDCSACSRKLRFLDKKGRKK